MPPLARLCAVAVAALVSGIAAGQAPTLPDSSALPVAPPRTSLPGVDNRLCGTSKWSALCATGRWSLFSTLDVEVKTAGFTGAYRLEQAANGELFATYREDARGHRRGGEAVIFGTEGLAFRTRDTLPPADGVIDYLVSAPLMMGKLVAVLLDQGVLGPPSDIVQSRAIRAGSTTQFIRTDAPRLAVLYGPPWSMTGTVKPDEDGRLAFSLRLNYRPVDKRGVPVPGKTDTLVLAGTVSYADKRPQLPDTFDLVGWKVMRGDDPLGSFANLAEARTAAGP